MTQQIETAVNPFLYAEGFSNGTLVPKLGPYGIPEVPITLNQSFFIDTETLFIPFLGFPLNGYRITFCNPGSPTRKKAMFIDVPGSTGHIDDCEHFFNGVNEESMVKTNGVIKVAAAGYLSGIRKGFYSGYRRILVSQRGVMTVVPVSFPWPAGPLNPRPQHNDNGIQNGSLLTFHTQDYYSIYCFDQPQDIRALLNTIDV